MSGTRSPSGRSSDMNASWSMPSPVKDDEEADDNYDVETARRFAAQQTTISTTRLENAQLKKSVAVMESENATLAVELHRLRSTLDSISSVSEGSNDLQMQLESAHEEIEALRDELKQAEETIHSMSDGSPSRERLSRHKAELQRARDEIERLSKTNEESDREVAQLESSMALRARRNRDDELDTLRAENIELKASIASLEAQTRFEQTRETETARMLDKFRRDFDRRVSSFTSTVRTSLMTIDTKFNALRKSVVQRRGARDNGISGDARDYLAQLADGIRSIERLTQDYAESHAQPMKDDGSIDSEDSL